VLMFHATSRSFRDGSNLRMPIPLIETPRLIIRDVQASDVDGLFRYMQQEPYWRDVPIEQPTVQSITALVNASLQGSSEATSNRPFSGSCRKALTDRHRGSNPSCP
jgi:hypothetical protein